MKNILKSIKNSLQNKNWYAVLICSLTLPDICGKLENPNLSSTNRYIKWFDAYLGSLYKLDSFNIKPLEDESYKKEGFKPTKISIVLLSGNDCYALRCAYLHEGKEDITEQNCRKTLDNFKFSTQDDVHRCYINDDTKKVLYLNVESFCKDICFGVEKWLEDMAKNKIVQNRISEMLKINESSFIKDKII